MEEIKRAVREEDGVTEYFTDRGVSIFVYRDTTSGHTMASLRGDHGERIDIRFADVPRLVQALNWAIEDRRKAGR